MVEDKICNNNSTIQAPKYTSIYVFTSLEIDFTMGFNFEQLTKKVRFRKEYYISFFATSSEIIARPPLSPYFSGHIPHAYVLCKQSTSKRAKILVSLGEVEYNSWGKEKGGI